MNTADLFLLKDVWYAMKRTQYQRCTVCGTVRRVYTTPLRRVCTQQPTPDELECLHAIAALTEI